MRGQRLQKLRQKLRQENLAGFLVSDFYNAKYLSGFSGLTPHEHEVYLLITQKDAFLFCDGRYFEAAKKLKTGFTPVLITSGQKFFQIIGDLVKKLKIKRLGFEKENLTVAEFEKLKKYPTGDARVYQLVTTEGLVEEIRALKEPQEIAAIKKATKITDFAFSHFLKILKPGLAEVELAWEIEKFIRQKGAELSFPSIVASGPNSSVPHHTTGRRKFKDKDIILIDFGGKVEGYCSDMTRVVFLGKATREQKKVYQTVLESQKLVIEHLGGGRMDSSEVKSPGIKARYIDKVAHHYITSLGYPTIPHGVGHGVGLSGHELPRLSPKSKDILKEGMIFTVEPGIYLSGEFGIRLEDLVVLTPSGPQILTKSPKTITEL